jgi:hypothetical protein
MAFHSVTWQLFGKGGVNMYKKLVYLVGILSIAALAGAYLAAPPFTVKQVIVYDGYLQQDVDFPTPGTTTLVADTLFVVNNGNKTAQLPVWIEIFDKYGVSVHEGTLYNGGNPLTGNLIPVDGFGWITLGMVVGRDSQDPYGVPTYGEKFLVKISTGKGDSGQTKAATVEVKQVIYAAPLEIQNDDAGEPIWNAALIKTWAETCLGGRNGPGVVKHPSSWGN